VENTINERLKILVSALGTNVGALSKVLGVSDSTVRNYIDRESKPGYEVLEKLYHSFKHINLPWLFGDPGEPLLTDTASPTNSTNISGKKNAVNVSGTNSGTATQNNFTIDDCRRDLAAAQKEIALLTSQLADKERTIQILMKQNT
jgi:transcriptional regulator with XRE-family HTH domain